MRSVFLTLLALAVGGCAGYHAGPIPPSSMKGITSIAVHNFKTDTLEPRIETLIANAVIKQIQQDGTFRVTDEKSADVILEGSLDDLERRPARGVRGNFLLSREYVLLLRASYTVTRRDTGKKLEARKVVGSTSFFVSGSNSLAADVHQDERQALPIAAEDLAVRLVSQISEGW